MIRGFGWLPRYDMDRRALHLHRTLHRMSVLWAGRVNDEARRANERDIDRLLDEVDAAIQAGMNEAPEQRLLRESGEWADLAAPEYWTDWQPEHAA